MDDSGETKDQSVPRIGPSLGPLRLVGWILGGLSLFNLIEAFSPLQFLGTLGKWMDAYT